MVGIVELAALYLRSLTRPEYLVLFPIFDLQLQWLCKSDILATSILITLC